MRANIFLLKNVKDTKINRALLRAQKDLEKFFRIHIDTPSLFLLDSRKDIDKFWGKITPAWMTGWALNGNIYILNPRNYTRESSHSIAHFWKVIRHEMCHVYFRELCVNNFPRWLNEGLACYLAGQEKKFPGIERLVNVQKYMRDLNPDIYAVGYFWVKTLIEKFGKEKLYRLLKTSAQWTTDANFAKCFKKIYGLGFSKKDLRNFLNQNI